MSDTIHIAVLQSAFSLDMDENIKTVSALVREAAAGGAQVILPPELFQTHYFCTSQEERWFAHAYPAMEHPCVTAMQTLAAELNVAIPVSIFEREGPRYYNSLVMLDAGGKALGVYRKSHIPDGPGYQEKYYFRPGDTGFKVWDTAFGRVGVGICWDQWFPECARAMTLMGAEVLLYPTAIGSEPHDGSLDTAARWRPRHAGPCGVQCHPRGCCQPHRRRKRPGLLRHQLHLRPYRRGPGRARPHRDRRAQRPLRPPLPRHPPRRVGLFPRSADGSVRTPFFMTLNQRTAKLTLRNATLEDVDAILGLQARAYPTMTPDPPSMIRGQISTFPEGQFIVEFDGEVVGWCASFVIDEAAAFAPHDWAGITGGGFAARHDPDGEWVYGMEVAVDPARRRLRIGERLYVARHALCEDWGLKGVVFGGRLSGYKRKRRLYDTPEAYLAAIEARELRDGVLNFQMRMGYEPAGVLHNYYPEDTDAGGHAALMVWRNPSYTEGRARAACPRPTRCAWRRCS